jgi:hypothetical protein
MNLPTVIEGFRYGLFLVPVNIIAYSQLRPDQNSKASSVTNLFRAARKRAIEEVPVIVLRNLSPAQRDLNTGGYLWVEICHLPQSLGNVWT